MDDASYKRLLGHERIVKDLLIGFIAPRRPAGWAETLDFDSLSEGPTESINDELRRRHDDVVWSIDRRAAPAGAGRTPPTRCCTWWSTMEMPAGTRP